MKDPDLFSGKLMSDNDAMQAVQRNKLLYYQGGHHGSCVQIREALNVLMKDRKIAPQVGGRVCTIILYIMNNVLYWLFFIPLETRDGLPPSHLLSGEPHDE